MFVHIRNICAGISAIYLHSCPLVASKKEGDQGQQSVGFKHNKLLCKYFGKVHVQQQFCSTFM